MSDYYIASTKYNLQERQTKKHGKVYDIVFRVVDPVTLESKQKMMRGFATKTLAKEAYLKFVQEHCEFKKGITAKKKDPEKQKLYVEDLIQEYLASMLNQNKESTIYSRKNTFKLFVLPMLSGVAIDKLDTKLLYQWQDKIWQMKNPQTNQYYNNQYLLKVRGHFNTFLSWVESRYDIPNQMVKVKKPKNRTPKKVMQFWTKEQFEQFISVVEDPMWHCFFTLAFYTGRRKGELFALTPEDIKCDRIVWNKSVNRRTFGAETYQVTSTKADKDDEVPICKIVQEELKNYNGQSPFFFGGEKPLAQSTVARRFQEYCNKAKVPIIRIHDLRHSFVSMLIHFGANFMVVADLISDEPEQVMKTYGHLYQDDKMSILEKIC